MEGKRYVCKLCNKSFLSGKVLGGHMRAHLAAKSDVKIESDSMSSDGYVLRENPKKSWRFSGSKHKLTPQIDEVSKCYVCDREFESPRSLHGHMRHHSKLERKGVHCQECGKAFKTFRALNGHMRLHFEKLSLSPNLGFLSLENAETINLVRRKRSNRARIKVTPTCSFSSLSESLPDIEIDEEAEEVAGCLIMLSRGLDNFAEICSVCGYYHDRCICSEVISLGQTKRIRRDGVDGNYQFSKEKIIEEFYDCEMVSCEEVNDGIEVETQNGSELVSLNPDTNLGIHDDMNFNPNEAEPTQDPVKEVGLTDAELSLCSSSNLSIVDDVPKTEFKCKICGKILPTHQALGGHQTGHRTSLNVSSNSADFQNDTKTTHSAENRAASKLELSENSVDIEVQGTTVGVDEESKRSRGYRCHICFKTFVSGQALGGHKKAHISKMKEEETPAFAPEMRAVFAAANLTDMDDGETNSGIGLGSWWSQNSCRHESLASLVAN